MTIRSIAAATVCTLVLFCTTLIPATSHAEDALRDYVVGGFSMQGYLNMAYGFQHFSNDPITEVAGDNSTGGVMGEWLPTTNNGTVPNPGESFAQAFIPFMELDMMKRFGERARLRADLFFGRTNSGSAIPAAQVDHAYLAVTLNEEHNIEVVLGRMGMLAGFEPYEPYFNDTISYSILWRAVISAGSPTGIMISGDVNEDLTLYFYVANGFVNDSIFKGNTLPGFANTIKYTWGSDAKPSALVITPFISPDSGGNSPLSMGIDAYTAWWLSERFELGLEGTYQRINANARTGGANTNYFAGLLNLHWEPTPRWYTVLKYCYANQTDVGNGVMNLTGAKQQIHEMSLGFGHYLADTVKFKGEGRFDIIDPAAGSSQWIVGAAIGMNVAF